MIAAIAALLLCATTAAERAPDVPRSLAVCVEIATVARAHGVDPRIAVAVGYVESRWRYGLVSSVGAEGPMQVLPRYHCDGGTLEGCDLVEAGVRSLRRYLDDEDGVTPALCRYATGTAHARCPYARQVLAVAGRPS